MPNRLIVVKRCAMSSADNSFSWLSIGGLKTVVSCSSGGHELTIDVILLNFGLESN